MISAETRAESYKTVDVETKKKQVLDCLGDREMTAKEVANEMVRRGYTNIKERNASAPRLTQLFEERKVVIVAKKIDTETGKKVCVYKKA
jgi:repressor of nif and glnA expression